MTYKIRERFGEYYLVPVSHPRLDKAIAVFGDRADAEYMVGLANADLGHLIRGGADDSRRDSQH